MKKAFIEDYEVADKGNRYRQFDSRGVAYFPQFGPAETNRAHFLWIVSRTAA
jgi:hypothetical protein